MYVYKTFKYSSSYVKITQSLQLKSVDDVNEAAIFRTKKAANTWIKKIKEKFPNAYLAPVKYVEVI